MLVLVDFLLDLAEIDVGNSILTVEDTCDVLECWAFGLNIKEVHKSEFTQVPKLEMN